MVLFFEAQTAAFPDCCSTMHPISAFIRVLVPIGLLVVLLANCGGEQEVELDLDSLRAEGSRFANLHDSVSYVGIESCRGCHSDIYESFLQTGMGRSMGHADLNRSKADFSGHAMIFDPVLQLSYQAFSRDSQLFIREFRLDGRDTIHQRIERISLVVGSGQHTNSHLININGYVYQLPMTFYTQDKKWDLPPGFENGGNSRFARTIETECMTCHNAYPKQVSGAENKYISIPQGIDCERCHGPGSLHIQEKLAGKIVDTGKEADYSIVNPKRLSMPLQMSICQRCHTQGNAVLKPGKTFFDFRPGMVLSDIMSVFLPRYEGDQSHFTMASHPDRMMQSACFTKSAGKLSCISCHNPHKSIEVTPAAHFNAKCQSCHPGQDECTAEKAVRKSKNDNCVSCHMPKSGTSDIPHVTITDHWIRKPEKSEGKNRTFIGIASINEKRPDALTKARAWLQYYERFEAKTSHLDSAAFYLKKVAETTSVMYFETEVHLRFLKTDYNKLIQLGSKIPAGVNGWTYYRIGEARAQNSLRAEALQAFKIAAALMPYQLDFQMKYATMLHELNQQHEAAERYEFILNENPTYAPAMVNLGFLKLESGADKEAEALYRKALKMDPDNQSAWMNLVGLELYRKNNLAAEKLLETIIQRYPNQLQARQLLQKLRS